MSLTDLHSLCTVYMLYRDKKGYYISTLLTGTVYFTLFKGKFSLEPDFR